MSFSSKISSLKWITVVYGLFAFIWISLEGSLVGVVLMGVGTTAVLLLYLAQYFLGDRTFSLAQWLVITAVCGLLLGLGSGLLTLLFMIVKTGLHAHGPEFTPSELSWVLQQIPLWALVGLLAGLGSGMVTGEKG